jgi:hypothetical protein
MDRVMAPLPVEQFNEPDPTAIAGVTATVPDVRGLLGPQAVATLQAAGFEAYVAAQVNSSAPVGTTVGTDPATGSQFVSGGTVRVFVSSGFVPPPPQPEPDNAGGGGDGNNGGGNNGNGNGGGRGNR